MIAADQPEAIYVDGVAATSQRERQRSNMARISDPPAVLEVVVSSDKRFTV